MKKRILSLLLAACLLLPMTACGAVGGAAKKLTQHITPQPLIAKDFTPGFDGATAAADFSVKLLQQEAGTDSVLRSPASILCTGADYQRR